MKFSHEHKIVRVFKEEGPGTTEEIIGRMKKRWRNVPTSHQIQNILARSPLIIKAGTTKKIGSNREIAIWDIVHHTIVVNNIHE